MNPVIPHYLGVGDSSSSSGARAFFDEVSLLVGEVVAIIQPDNAANQTGKFTEYTVIVWRRRGNGSQERIKYRCFQADLFGSVADWLRFSYRPSTSDPFQQGQGSQAPSLTNGATVLIACINGDRSNAYIIGAMPQPNRQQADPSQSEGRYLRSRFNGVEMKVNDDGSFELLVPGATDTDGNPDNRDSDNHGSKLTFAANGDITIDDQNGESVKVSPGSKSIAIESEKKLTEKTDTGEVTAGTSWKLTAPKVIVVSPDVSIGGEDIPMDNGAVFGEGVDVFTGLTYDALQNASKTVRVTK